MWRMRHCMTFTSIFVVDVVDDDDDVVVVVLLHLLLLTHVFVSRLREAGVTLVIRLIASQGENATVHVLLPPQLTRLTCPSCRLLICLPMLWA